MTLDDARAVLRLTHEVRDLRLDPDAAHARLIDGLAALVDAGDGVLYAVRGYRRGGAAAFVRVVGCAGGEPIYRRYMAELTARVQGVDNVLSDPFADRTVDRPAPRQTAGLWDLLAGDRGDNPDRSLRHYPATADVLHASHFRDGLASFCRGTLPGSVSLADAGNDLPLGVALHRFGGARRYSARDRAVLAFALEEVARLMETGALPPVVGTHPPLPPRLAEVLRRVLAGEAPKEMARAMKLSIHTVREHLERLYKHHGVQGRAELVAAVLKA